MHVPDSPAGLDAAWLQTALAGASAFEGARIHALDVRIIGVGYGLDGVAAHVTLVAEGGPPDRPASLVVKFAPAPRGPAEVSFYERVAPHMPIRLPRYYGGFVSAEAQHAVLLLEDLTAAVQGDCIVGATLTQAEAVLSAMARFHAAFLGGEHPALAEIQPWDARLDSIATKLEERLPRFFERYGTRIDPRARQHLEGLPARLPEIFERLWASEITLAHTDLHLDNVLFPTEDEAVILDWPDARLGPPILDVNRFFVEGATPELRREHGPALLDLYRQVRTEAGAPCVSVEELAHLRDASVLYHLAYAASWGGAEKLDFTVPRVREIVDCLIRNTSAAAADLPP